MRDLPVSCGASLLANCGKAKFMYLEQAQTNGVNW